MNERAMVSVNGFLKPTEFCFQIIEVWPLGDSTMVGIKGLTDAARELVDRLSMWGGPTKQVERGEDRLLMWEFDVSGLHCFARICDRTRATRPTDLVKLDPAKLGVKINLNDRLLVELTDEGKKLNEDGSFGFKFPLSGPQGRAETTGWEFAQVFGPYLYPGNPRPPCNMNVWVVPS